MPSKSSVVQKINGEIAQLSSMSALARDKFCEEGGYADRVAKDVGSGREKLNATQLRRVFGELKNIERSIKREESQAEFERGELVKLMPVLAYAKGRGLMPADFYELMKTCLSARKLQTNEDFRRAFEFVEAILAFYKFHYPKG